VADVTAALESYRFNEATARVYQFIWRELCDWYIELVKPRLYEGSPEEKGASARVLRDVLEGSLRLLHPFMPFVTEEIWQKLPRAKDDPASIMIADYPRPDPARMSDAEADRFDTLIEIVQAVRSLRVDLQIPEGAAVELHFDADPTQSAWLAARGSWLERLAKVKGFRSREEGTWPESSPSILVRGIELRLPIGGLVDVAELRSKLEKDAQKLEVEVKKIEGRLGNPGFVKKAPPEVIEKDRALADELAGKLAKTRENLTLLKG
jgi:valyl-tRNA synthetase